MDIVDIQTLVNKYNVGKRCRHISSTCQMSYWISINDSNRYGCIHKKYSKLLNIRNINVILNCIEHNIKVSIIFYQMTSDNVELMFKKALDRCNLYYLNLISNNYDTKIFVEKLGKLNMYKYTQTCSREGNLNVLKFMYFKLNIEVVGYVNIVHASRNEYLNILKFFHKIDDYNNQLEGVCSAISTYYKCSMVKIIKYFHRVIMMDKKVFESCGNKLLSQACNHGQIDALRYLCEYIKIDMSTYKRCRCVDKKIYRKCEYKNDDGHKNATQYLCTLSL